MDKNYSDIDLARYYSGEASPEEMECVENWSKLSSHNMEMFLGARFVWERSLKLDKLEFDTEKALSKVQGKLDFGQDRPVWSLVTIKKIAGIAAAILIPVIIFFSLYQKRSESETAYQVTVTSGEIRYVKLADGSEVWLNKNSRLQVPEKFTGNQFRLKLEGEAYFMVAKNPGRVFAVETAEAVVKVLGTAFNLKATRDEKKSVLSVTEGKVLCTSWVNEEKIVEKGEEAVISPNSAIALNKLANENFLSWKTKILRFRETPLGEVAKALGDFYNTSFVIEDSQLRDLPVSTTLNNAPLNEVVKLLQMASDDITIVKSEKGYIVTKKK